MSLEKEDNFWNPGGEYSGHSRYDLSSVLWEPTHESHLDDWLHKHAKVIKDTIIKLIDKNHMPIDLYRKRLPESKWHSYLNTVSNDVLHQFVNNDYYKNIEWIILDNKNIIAQTLNKLIYASHIDNMINIIDQRLYMQGFYDQLSLSIDADGGGVSQVDDFITFKQRKKIIYNIVCEKYALWISEEEILNIDWENLIMKHFWWPIQEVTEDNEKISYVLWVFKDTMKYINKLDLKGNDWIYEKYFLFIWLYKILDSYGAGVLYKEEKKWCVARAIALANQLRSSSTWNMLDDNLLRFRKDIVNKLEIFYERIKWMEKMLYIKHVLLYAGIALTDNKRYIYDLKEWESFKFGIDIDF